MGVKLGLVETTFSPAEDWTWLGGEGGTDSAEPITLDGSAFLALFPTGVIPSGTPIGKVTSSGKYGPYDPGVHTAERQSIIATGGTVGDFTLGFYGETTAAIAWNAAAADVKAALLLLPNIDPADIVVAGGPLPETAVTVEFHGQYEGQNVPLLVVTDNITNGTATVTTPQAGGTTGADTTAGLGTCQGLLFTTQDVGVDGADVAAALYVGPGSVIEANLPTTIALDAAAKAALKLIRFR